jgi:type I restriction enzyme S subunit
MISDWKQYKLEEVCRRITSGGTPLTSKKEYYENGTIPWLKTTEVHKEIIRETDTYITEEGLKNSSAKLIEENSIVVAMYGDGGTAGKIALTKIPLSTNQACCNLTVDERKAFHSFIYYYLKINYDNLVNLKSGGSQQNLNALTIRKFPILLPPLPTQQRIASILSAYDDLIEVNNQRIKLLEETARELYKEWFVRMRFPGYKQAKFVKGMPKGWEVKPMAALCLRITDGTHDTPKPLNTGYPLITGKHIIDGFIDFTSAYYISEKDHRQISKRSGLSKGDILLSNIGTIGSASIVDYENEFSVKNVVIYKPLKTEYSAFIYYYLTNPNTVEQFMSDAFGTSQQFLSLGYCRKLKAFIPGEDLILKFGEHVNAMIKLKYTLQKQNTQLRQIRDRLLPRLITGKLEVKEKGGL